MKQATYTLEYYLAIKKVQTNDKYRNLDKT